MCAEVQAACRGRQSAAPRGPRGPQTCVPVTAACLRQAAPLSRDAAAAATDQKTKDRAAQNTVKTVEMQPPQWEEIGKGFAPRIKSSAD